ncbi:MAG: hypothetical protein Kow0081_4490 [Candidatus Dojkabacteria bacterium]
MAKSLQGLTMRKATKIKRIRKFGFMSRMQKWTGQNVLKRRRAKGRTKLTASSEFGGAMKKNKLFSRRK